MKREDLLRSREYWITQIQLHLFELIENYRKENNLNKTQLAEKLGVTKSYITQILNGDFDHKVSKLVDLALAFNKTPIIQYKDLENIIAKDHLKALSYKWSAEVKQDEVLSHFAPIDFEEICDKMNVSSSSSSDALSATEISHMGGQVVTLNKTPVYS